MPNGHDKMLDTVLSTYDMHIIMKLTAQIQLLPDAKQSEYLKTNHRPLQ